MAIPEQAKEFDFQLKIKKKIARKKEQVYRLFRKRWCGMEPVFQGYQASLLNSLSRQCEVFENLPKYRIFKNLIYMPQYNCLYSADGYRIDYSCLYRGVGALRRNETKSPERIEIPVKLDRIEQTYIYIGEIRKHFGHFLTESISRLWITNEFKEYPVIYHLKNGTTSNQEKLLFDTLLEPVNLINKERLVTFSRPVIIDKIIIPQPSFVNLSNAYQVHSLFPENFARNTLPQQLETTSQPLYLSRRLLESSSRNIINELELEKIFLSAGFAICYPEQLSLREQALLINKHEVIIGPIGSALHSILFDISSHRNIVCLTDKDHFNPNFIMIDAIKSFQSTYVAALTLDPNCNKYNKNSRWKQNRIADVDMIVEALSSLGLM